MARPGLPRRKPRPRALRPFHRGLLGHARRGAPYTRPEHVRLALGELGATFIKLGQVLSTRPDLVPPDYQAELAKLQDDAPVVPIEAIRDAVASELGRPAEQVFAEFDPVPLAAASIGQVHASGFADGTEVVVKVRRPGVVEEVERDLEILRNLATSANRRWALAEQYDLVGLVEEFGETMRADGARPSALIIGPREALRLDGREGHGRVPPELRLLHPRRRIHAPLPPRARTARRPRRGTAARRGVPGSGSPRPPSLRRKPCTR